MQTPWEYRYANRTKRMGSSVIRELLKLTEQPDIISFAIQYDRRLPAAAGNDRPANRPLCRIGYS